MTEQPKGREYKLLLQIREDQLPAAVEAMARAGISINPAAALVSIDHDYDLPNDFNHSAVNYGCQIPDLVQAINEYLTAADSSPLIRQDTDNWQLNERADFLEMATCMFQFNGFKVAVAWWKTQNKSWQEVLQDYPAIPLQPVSANP